MKYSEARRQKPDVRVVTAGECALQIELIELETEAEVPNVDQATFQEKVYVSQEKCPVSMALAGHEKRVNARLVGDN